MDRELKELNIERPVRVKKFLFVEEGSVDIETLEARLGSNPEIAVVIYRAGSVPPQLVENKKK